MISDREHDAEKSVMAEIASLRMPPDTLTGPCLTPSEKKRLFAILDARFRAWTGQSLKEFSTKETA